MVLGELSLACGAMEQATSLSGRFTSLADLPEDGISTGGGSSIKIPTQIRAAAAGLGGVVWQAGGVMCLDLPAMQAEAQARGLFLWAR